MARILVVDDDRAIQALLDEALAFEGYDVVCAANGAQGIELAHAEQPDVILMDIMMPCLDGAEATRQLKADPLTRHIPVIAMSAGATLLLHATELPADAALGKPFDLAVLLANVAMYLEAERDGSGGG